MSEQHTEQHQTHAVRMQSSAIVAAAFITTLGAITAACIQTGWLGKPQSESNSSLQGPAPLFGTIAPADSSPTALASFTGTIESVREVDDRSNQFKIELPDHSKEIPSELLLRACSTPSAVLANTKPIQAVPVAAMMPVTQPSPAPAQMNLPTKGAPALLPQQSLNISGAQMQSSEPVQIFNSPWETLKQPYAGEKPADSQKPARKWYDLTRLLPGHS